MMELSNLHFLLLSLIIPFVCLCFAKLILMRKKSENATGDFYGEKQRFLPGNTGWPLLGENLEFYSKLQKGVVENFMTDRRNKYSSRVFKTSLFGHRMAIFCDAEGNKFLFSNEKYLVQHWWPSAIDRLFPKSDKRPNTEHIKSLRKLLAIILKGDVLREYVGTMDAIVKKHIQTDFNSKNVKVNNIAKRYILKLACYTFLGMEDPTKFDEIIKGADDIALGLHSIPINIPGTNFHRAMKASKLMRNVFEEIVRQRRVNLSEHNSTASAEDFVSHMLVATDDNGRFYSEANIASHILGLLQGAYSGVQITITNIMMYLAEFPDVYNSVLTEQKEIADSKEPEDKLNWEDLKKMKYTWSVACEVLRLKTPGPGGFKESLSDFKYGGYTIPKGYKIHWSAQATHKNPEYFPDPEKFDPSRFQGNGPASYTFVPFGGGTRMCPGNEYARIAILIFLHNVVIKFRWEKLIPDEKYLNYPFPQPAQGLPIHLYQ